jgi:Uma2 family endonuclease
MVQAPPQSQPLLLQLPSELALQVTSEQFVVLAAANPDLRLERTATGALIVNPPTGGNTGKRNWSIAGELYLWWRNAQEPGEAFDSSTGFELPNGAHRSPDTAWGAGHLLQRKISLRCQHPIKVGTPMSQDFRHPLRIPGRARELCALVDLLHQRLNIT